jgi:hypothetical protein
VFSLRAGPPLGHGALEPPLPPYLSTTTTPRPLWATVLGADGTGMTRLVRPRPSSLTPVRGASTQLSQAYSTQGSSTARGDTPERTALRGRGAKKSGQAAWLAQPQSRSPDAPVSTDTPATQCPTTLFP